MAATLPLGGEQIPDRMSTPTLQTELASSNLLRDRVELLRATNIGKTFPVATGELTVLEDISVAIYSGEVVALLGRSGSGKSTLLRILAGLIPASEGKVFASGKELIGPNPGEWRWYSRASHCCRGFRCWKTQNLDCTPAIFPPALRK